MKKQIKLKNIWLHLCKIHKHRKYVFKYCCLAGIPWRGITHDLSKYSPTEFWESVKYYVGISSPIDAAKEAQGYSLAWLHHRGRNTHHWAYWTDNYSEGLVTYDIPKKDFIELICDFLGAGHAYSEKEFSYMNELEWWIRAERAGCKGMSYKNKIMVSTIFHALAKAELDNKNPEQLIKNGLIQDTYDKVMR